MRQGKNVDIKQMLLIICLVVGIVVFFRITKGGQLLWSVSYDTLTRAGAPTYSYINSVEVKTQIDASTIIVNDIYPMNEYLLAEEVYYEEEPAIEVSGGTVINIMETGAEETYEEESIQEGEDISYMSEDVAQAISNEVIKGKVYSKAELTEYTFSKRFYTVTGITSLTKDIFRPEEFLEKDLSIKKDASKPQILIFHTHSQEDFVDSVKGEWSTSIVGVGDYLARLLREKYGYNVIHDKSVYDLVDGVLDRSKAYTYAQAGIEKILKENPTIEVVIDLHRDGVGENMHLVTEVDGKNMAKLMFFNGISYTNVNGNISYLNNPYRDDNLAMSLQMYLLGEAYYPGFLRNNYINAYRYCLHNRGRSMLVEAGAQTNTFGEVKNAMEPLADMLNKLLSGQKVY